MTKPLALVPLSLRWCLPLRHVPWILGLVLLVVLLEVVVQSRWVVPWVIEQTGWTPKRGPSDELLDRIVWGPMIEEALFRLALIPGLVGIAAFLGNPGVRRPQEAWRLLPWFGVVSLVGCVGLNAFDVLKAVLDQRQWSPAIVFITPLVLAWLSLGLRLRHPSGQLSPGWLIGCAAVTNTLFALGHLYNYPDLPHHPAVLGLAIPQLMRGRCSPERRATACGPPCSATGATTSLSLSWERCRWCGGS